MPALLAHPMHDVRGNVATRLRKWIQVHASELRTTALPPPTSSPSPPLPPPPPTQQAALAAYVRCVEAAGGGGGGGEGDVFLVHLLHCIRVETHSPCLKKQVKLLGCLLSRLQQAQCYDRIRRLSRQHALDVDVLLEIMTRTRFKDVHAQLIKVMGIVVADAISTQSHGRGRGESADDSEQPHVLRWIRCLKAHAEASQPHACRDAVVESLAMSGVFEQMKLLVRDDDDDGGEIRATAFNPTSCQVLVESVILGMVLMQDEYGEVRAKMCTAISPHIDEGQHSTTLHEQMVLEHLYAMLARLAKRGVDSAARKLWSRLMISENGEHRSRNSPSTPLVDASLFKCSIFSHVLRLAHTSSGSGSGSGSGIDRDAVTEEQRQYLLQVFLCTTPFQQPM
jgi:hypothetical protein